MVDFCSACSKKLASKRYLCTTNTPVPCGQEYDGFAGFWINWEATREGITCYNAEDYESFTPLVFKDSDDPATTICKEDK